MIEEESGFSWRWLYVMAYYYYIKSALIAFVALKMFFFEGKEFPVLFLLIPAGIAANFGYGLKNKKFSVVFWATIFTLNPIIWIVNYFYFRERQYEMDP